MYVKDSDGASGLDPSRISRMFWGEGYGRGVFYRRIEWRPEGIRDREGNRVGTGVPRPCRTQVK